MTVQTGDTAPDFTATTSSGHTITLQSLLDKGPACLVFLRFLGCPLSRLRLTELEEELDQFKGQNLQLLVILETRPDRAHLYLEKRDMHVELVPDLERKLYDLYDVKSGGVLPMLNPKVLSKATKATIKGHMHGPFEGNELQLPAAFIIGKDGKIKFTHYGAHPADTIPTADILSASASI